VKTMILVTIVELQELKRERLKKNKLLDDSDLEQTFIEIISIQEI
ncbi:16011_t:CDS:1, partial [Gigaspora rosea]